jgi:peptide/nickel transport system substrate-binding protein
MKKMNRRSFLRASAMTLAGIAAASCAQPTPQVIEKEVPVEKVVKETVVVEKEVAVEKVVTATAVETQYNEAPMLSGLVRQGELPPVDERLPDEPLVHTPAEEVGEYGGTWHRLSTSPGDVRTPDRLNYESLIRWNVMGTEQIPNVAKSWEISPDGTTFTFQLRKGMKWSDGEPFTADDIVFYYEDVLQNEELNPSFPKTWTVGGEPVVVTKVDDYTVRFSFPLPSGVFLVDMASAAGRWWALYPEHYLQQFHIEYADQAKLDAMVEEAGFEEWYQLFGDKFSHKTNTELPVIHAWQITVPAPKQPVVMERNPFYWKVDTDGNQLPYIDTVEHMIVAGAEQVNLRAISGEVDMQTRHILFDNFPLFQENKEQGGYRILQWKRGYITDAAIYPNAMHQDPEMREILGDKRFHWALSLGINRAEIIEGVYLGITEPTQVSPFPSSPFYWEEQAQNMLEHDPDRANEILDEMGLTERDGDGYRLRPNGERLSITFSYAPIFGSWGDIGELLRAHWEELGIELILDETNRQLYVERFQANEHDMAIWQSAAEFNPLILPMNFVPIHGNSRQAIPAADWYLSGGKEGEEPTGDLRETFDLWDQIKATADFEEQQQLFRQILELNKENIWVIGICTAPPEIVIVKENFRNVPEEAVSDWNLLTPGATAPEQYFIRQS